MRKREASRLSAVGENIQYVKELIISYLQLFLKKKQGKAPVFCYELLVYLL